MKRTDGWKEWLAAALLILNFWNVFYPEFTLTEEVYRPVFDEGTDRETSGRMDYEKILNAQAGEVEVRLSFLDNRKGKPVARKEAAPDRTQDGEEGLNHADTGGKAKTDRGV